MEVAPVLARGPRHVEGAITQPWARRGPGFEKELGAAINGGNVHIVQRGETLSEIIAGRLDRLGAERSTAAIYDGVAKVARANGISNADVIFPGERVDLSILSKGRVPQIAGASGTVSAAVGQSKELGGTPSFDGMRPWSNLLTSFARLTSPFGARTDPLSGGHRDHHGLDLAARPGTTITPLLAGEVVYSGRKGAYGNAVIIRHSAGMETLYGHNARNLVKKGDRVSAETPLGVVGSTGRSTGPHLHFEVRRNGRAVDPMPYVSQGTLASARRPASSLL